MLHWCWSYVGFRGPPPKADALTVDLEAASRAFDRMLAVPWIKEAVKNWDSVPSLFIAQKYFTLTPDLFQYKPIACTPCDRKGLFPVQVNLTILCDLLLRSRTTLKSPEIILILLTCPLLQENAMKQVLELAFVIAELSKRTLKLLGTQRKQKDKLTSRNVGSSFSSFHKTCSTSVLKMEVDLIGYGIQRSFEDWLKRFTTGGFSRWMISESWHFWSDPAAVRGYCKSPTMWMYCVLCSAEDRWSLLTPSILLKHILVFKNTLGFMLRNGLLITHNAQVRYLLEALKLLYRVSAASYLQICFLLLLFLNRTSTSHVEVLKYIGVNYFCFSGKQVWKVLQSPAEHFSSKWNCMYKSVHGRQSLVAMS